MQYRGVFLAMALVAGAISSAAEDEKDLKKKEKKGTAVGALTAKGENWIEVKADGEDKARRYLPYWRGGLPKDGGGLDKKMLATIKTLKVGSRLRVEWGYDERYRVEKIEVLKPSGKGKEAQKNGDKQ